MRNTLYRQMVYWINAHRTWIEVADDNLYEEHIISRSDRTDYLVSRTLVLRAFKANGTYLEGTTWAIPEHELDKALAIYRKQDRSFKQRIKKAAMNLTAVDAETIIRLATYGIVHLELRATPLHVPEKTLLLMLLKVLQLIFCVSPLVLSLILYKKPFRFMAKLHAAMSQNIRARKLYTRVILFLLLLFHYVYASGHAGEFGILVSTVICAAMFSFRLADRCLSRLHDSMGLFAGISAITLVSCFEPYLYTTTVTAYYILLAALFYPSAPVTVECNNEEKAEGMTTHSETISEENHDNHHAMVPDEADNGSIS